MSSSLPITLRNSSYNLRTLTSTRRGISTLASLTNFDSSSLATAPSPVNRLSALSSQLSFSSSSRITSIQQPTPHQTRKMSSLPQTMKAVQIQKNGGVEVLEYTDIPVPKPGDNQVLVKNDFIGVNFIDTYFRTGLYPAPQFPHVLGRELAGTVVAVGSGETYGIKEGDRVVSTNAGGYAEYSAVNTLHTYKIPDGIDTKTACATLIQGLTAWTLMRDAHYVNKGDWVLIPAAAGGMGLWLCQLLKAIGARVIGTASTPEKRELAKKNGAEVVLEYAETMGHEQFVNKVREITGGPGPIAVFDGVGKSTFDVSLEVVARKGTLASFGNASGAVPPFTIARLATKNVKLLRPTLFHYITTREEFMRNTDELFKLMKEHSIDVRIHKVYDLKDAASAQTDLEGRKTTGKLLLKP